MDNELTTYKYKAMEDEIKSLEDRIKLLEVKCKMLQNEKESYKKKYEAEIAKPSSPEYPPPLPPRTPVTTPNGYFSVGRPFFFFSEHGHLERAQSLDYSKARKSVIAAPFSPSLFGHENEKKHDEKFTNIDDKKVHHYSSKTWNPDALLKKRPDFLLSKDQISQEDKDFFNDEINTTAIMKAEVLKTENSKVSDEEHSKNYYEDAGGYMCPKDLANPPK